MVATRERKYLRPICPYHEAPERKSARWWETCVRDGHDPYYSETVELVREPIRERRGDEVVITGWTEREVVRRTPNIAQVTVSNRVHGGRLEEVHVRHDGYILPEEHPTDPLAPFCEYRDCLSQEITQRTPWGNYCSLEHAVAIRANLNPDHIWTVYPPDKWIDELNQMLSSAS
jgi:hypothetical protein